MKTVNSWKNKCKQRKNRLDKYVIIKKTEYMECGPQINWAISIDGKDLKKATGFKNLGSVISSDGDTLLDSQTQVNAAWMKWRQVSGVLCDQTNAHLNESQDLQDRGSPLWIGTYEDGRKRMSIAPIVEKMEEGWLRWYGHRWSDEGSVARTALRLNPHKDYRIPKTCHSYSFEWGKIQRFMWPLNRRKPHLLNERANC